MAKDVAKVRSATIQNRKARHDYEILEVFEAGIALQGSEVKSLRAGQVQLRDAYARVEDGELWLLGLHVSPYPNAVGFGAHDPDRKRKLLVHRRQINELDSQVNEQRLALVPLSIYWKDGKAKVELAVARGRKSYDKRHAIAARDQQRDTDREYGTQRGRDR